MAEELLQPPLPQAVCNKPPHEVFVKKIPFFREGEKGPRKGGEVFNREDADQAALLHPSAPWSPRRV